MRTQGERERKDYLGEKERDYFERERERKRLLERGDPEGMNSVFVAGVTFLPPRALSDRGNKEIRNESKKN